MRVLIIILILLNAPFICEAENNIEKKKKKGEDIGYYENMSMLFFIRNTAYFDSTNDFFDKTSIADDFSTVMFNYWLTTRLGELQASQLVDKAIVQSYQGTYANDKKFSRIFEDPLLWFNRKKPAVKTANYNFKSKDEYMEILERYYKFVGIKQSKIVYKGIDPRLIPRAFEDEVVAVTKQWKNQQIKNQRRNINSDLIDELLLINKAGFSREYIWINERNPKWTKVPKKLNIEAFLNWAKKNLKIVKIKIVLDGNPGRLK